MMAQVRKLTCFSGFGVECCWCGLCPVGFGAEDRLRVSVAYVVSCSMCGAGIVAELVPVPAL